MRWNAEDCEQIEVPSRPALFSMRERTRTSARLSTLFPQFDNGSAEA